MGSKDDIEHNSKLLFTHCGKVWQMGAQSQQAELVIYTPCKIRLTAFLSIEVSYHPHLILVKIARIIKAWHLSPFLETCLPKISIKKIITQQSIIY